MLGQLRRGLSSSTSCKKKSSAIIGMCRVEAVILVTELSTAIAFTRIFNPYMHTCVVHYRPRLHAFPQNVPMKRSAPLHATRPRFCWHFECIFQRSEWILQPRVLKRNLKTIRQRWPAAVNGEIRGRFIGEGRWTVTGSRRRSKLFLTGKNRVKVPGRLGEGRAITIGLWVERTWCSRTRI